MIATSSGSATSVSFNIQQHIECCYLRAAGAFTSRSLPPCGFPPVCPPWAAQELGIAAPPYAKERRFLTLLDFADEAVSGFLHMWPQALVILMQSVGPPAPWCTAGVPHPTSGRVRGLVPLSN